MPMVPVTRSTVRLRPDPTRRIVKPFFPADHGAALGVTRTERILNRVLTLSPEEVSEALTELRAKHAHHNSNLDDLLLAGFTTVEHWLEATEIDDDRRRLIGAYFIHEYSIEGSALTNPSIVAAPDQTGVPEDWLRVVVSLRAVGEGHISSIEFRTGMVDPEGNIEIEDPGVPVLGQRRTPLFDRTHFTARLEELGVDVHLVHRALGDLDDSFTMEDLEKGLAVMDDQTNPAIQDAIHMVHWLASSNYEVTFDPNTEISQRVLAPNGPAESQGMEDARFVRFVESDGSIVYYSTYTAYDGARILPQLIQTSNFETFRIATLRGQAAVNKGMALFPRPIGGMYVALGRSDGESNYLMVSDHVRFWGDATQIQVPARSWELLQIGNAGAPIETEAGWLVVTHGVGPMREYALGAILLDIDDPTRVLGHLTEPLLGPNEEERYGYVPNVVYSCGSLVHNGHLVIAYGASDTFTTFASVSLEAVLAALVSSRDSIS